MNHPFFDEIAFPWSLPLAGKLHQALYITIKDPNKIEQRCRKCFAAIQLTIPATPETLWYEALDRLATACMLNNFCKDLLANDSVKSIHPIVELVVNAGSFCHPPETDGNTEGAKKDKTSGSNESNSAFVGLDKDATTTSSAFDESGGIAQLIKIATEHLKKCEEAKQSIILFNDDLKEPMSPGTLARTMLESGFPMRYLFNCTHRPCEFTAARESHYKKCMLSLANVFAPLCLGTKNLKSVAEMVKNAAEPFTEISTKEPLIAKAVVGLIHGVPIDGHDSSEEIFSGRDFASSFSIPEKLDEKWDDIVQLFILGLAKFLRARRKVLEAVRAALKVQQQKGVHLCVLFTVSHNVEALKKLKNAIPELILLVSSAEDESDTNYEVLTQFRDVNAFFGA